MAAPLGGLVEQMRVDVGQEVKKGELLVQVDRKMYAAQQKLAKVELKDAERELARVESMGKAVASARVVSEETSTG